MRLVDLKRRFKKFVEARPLKQAANFQVHEKIEKIKFKVTGVVSSTKEKVRGTIRKEFEIIINPIIDKQLDKAELRADDFLGKLDDAASKVIPKYVIGVTVGLWGATTVAAISLVVAAMCGSFSHTWATYVILASGFVFLWNLSSAIYYWREYKKLSGDWRHRAAGLIASKLRIWFAVALGGPILVFVGLVVIRLVFLV